MAHSPWGQIQVTEQYTRGVSRVHTAGHGGIKVSLVYAKKHLSQEAIKNGILYNNYLFFEEDCDAAILNLELPITRKQGVTDEELIKELSLYHAKYLLNRGIAPEKENYARFLKSEDEWRRRAENCPNLVTWASHLNDEQTKVGTADGKEYIVNAQSYTNRKNQNLNELTLA